MIKLRNYISFILLFSIALFMLGANPFKSETIAPMDLLLKYPGWKNTNITVPYINGERSDVLDAKLPIWTSAKKDLHQGEIPFWNYQRAGKPGLTFTNSLLTPAFLVFALVKDDALGFYLSNLINVLIGLLGMYLFLRLFFRKNAAIFGALIFMFSGFNAAWFFWAHVHTAVWTPWVLFTVYKYISTQNKFYLPFVTLSMLMLNLGGFPMIAVMTYMSVAIMVIIFLITRKSSLRIWINNALYLGVFSIFSIMIALPFVYPLVELLEWMGGIGYRHGGAGFKMHEFQLFINPNLYRYPRVETTFYVGILPVLFLPLALILFIIKPKFIGAFSLILFLYSVTIAFTLISPEIIHKIPTLNSSLLTRFGYLIGFSLAVTSAYVINEFTDKFMHKKWFALLIIVVFTGQIWDQKNLFKQFNAPVPNASFLPQTKTIDYLQNTLEPFEYIIADNGFLIAGTLGGYGLNDWYAHSFHNTAEKEVLASLVNRPFSTPTSAIFPFHDIDLSSPYIDFLHIKSILSTSFSKYTYIPLWNNKRAQAPAPVMPTNKLIQPFHIEKFIKTKGIAFLMATFGAKHASSDVKLVLTYEGNNIATSVVRKEKIIDNEWITFLFDDLMHLSPGDYHASIHFLNETNAHALTIWTNTEETTHRLLVNGKATNSSLKMALIQDKVMHEKYKILNLEPNIHIIENTHVKKGAYFLNSLHINQSIEHDKVSTSMISNTRVEVTYKGEKEGWIILPMRAYPGWEVTVNDQQTKIEKFLGILPAIKVFGKSKIIISYNPTYNTYTYFTAVLGLLFLLLSILFYRKGQRT